MALYAASVVFGGPEIQAVADLRRLTELSIAQIRERLRSETPILMWDTDEFELTAELENHIAGILREIESLLEKGYDLRFRYAPSNQDGSENVTLEQVRNLMESEVLYSRQPND